MLQANGQEVRQQISEKTRLGASLPVQAEDKWQEDQSQATTPCPLRSGTICPGTSIAETIAIRKINALTTRAKIYSRWRIPKDDINAG